MTDETNEGLDLSAVISLILKYGVILSSVLVAIGLILILPAPPSGFPTTVQQLTSSNYGKPTLDFGVLFTNVAAGNPIFIIQLGLVVLLATPVVRVAASVFVFGEQKDKLYMAITLFVLAILLLSIFVIGPLEA